MTRIGLSLILSAILNIVSFPDLSAQNTCAENGTLLFWEDFGGNDPGDPMTSPVGIGTKSEYEYQADITNPSNFGSNKYTITKEIPDAWRNAAWVEICDHTHWNDKTRGYCFLVNGDTKKKVYELEIDGLCAGSQLYFSIWAANIVEAGRGLVLPDLEFLITDMSDIEIASYRTGETIPEMETLTWEQYGIDFIVPASTTKLKFKVYSYGNGGNGNDYVIDDIAVYLCTNKVNALLNGNSGKDIS